ncbi:MAG TPA: DUF4350 domain-containing protein [Pyrinomonadaceae bacterium]|nr:DUF4350 domain-containing protein [Pyrinomonadaceae bacterium]
MRQRLYIFLGLIFLAIVLVVLNVASYVQKEKVPDSEANPNRSTYNTGASGARAFFDLLNETGRRAVRWQEPPLGLLSEKRDTPETFVVVGHLQREFTEEEIEHLLRWVSEGGKLVVVDREPPPKLVSTSAGWSVKIVPTEGVPLGVDPWNPQQMTDKVTAGKSVQPSIFTRNVNAVQPSRFASSVKLEFLDEPDKGGGTSGIGSGSASPTPKYGGINQNPGNFRVKTPTPVPVFSDEDEEYNEPPPPKPKPTVSNRGSGQGSGIGTGQPPPKAAQTPAPEIETTEQNAPVVHLANKDKTLLVDFPYGSGQIVYISDPYMISNGGIRLVDNAQMAINAVAASDAGTIAFDEYHHGYGANENRVLAYFAGTPVAAIFVQVLLLIGVVLFTQSRRFARPLPADEPNRLSKLEYVSAMAELQQRTRAYDLALENIYSEFRRTMARFVGVDNYQTPRGDLARLIAEKSNLDAAELENLMFKCEEIIHGEPTGKKEVLQLASRLREIEEKLGLKRQRTTRKGM